MTGHKKLILYTVDGNQFYGLTGTPNMAAVNYIKNRRCQKIRQGLEYFIARCLDGEDSVDMEKVVEIFQTSNLTIDEKEMEKLSSIANQDKIPK